MRSVLLLLLTVTGVAEAKPAHLQSYGAHGSTSAVIARGRAHKGKPASGTLARGTIGKLGSSVRAFTRRDLENPRVVLTDPASGKSIEVVGDDEGFYEARLPGPFPAGPRRVVITLNDRRYTADPVEEEALLVEAGPVLVTDIDDTLIETGVTGSKAELVVRVLSQDAADVKPLDGAAETLRAFSAAGIPVVYLSASPTELAPRLRQVLSLRGFPPGPVFLRYYKGDGIGDPSGYKRRVLDRLLADLPKASFLLLGDNGEQDPAIFAKVAKDTGRVSHRFVRTTLATAADATFLFKTYPELLAYARAQKLIP